MMLNIAIRPMGNTEHQPERTWFDNRMKTVSIRDAKNRLTELARKVEKGKTIVVTRNGSPVFDLVPHKKTGGLDIAAGRAYLRSKRIENPVPFIADDFDEPLPEDFLVRPLPRG